LEGSRAASAGTELDRQTPGNGGTDGAEEAVKAPETMFVPGIRAGANSMQHYCTPTTAAGAAATTAAIGAHPPAAVEVVMDMGWWWRHICWWLHILYFCNGVLTVMFMWFVDLHVSCDETYKDDFANVRDTAFRLRSRHAVAAVVLKNKIEFIDL